MKEKYSGNTRASNQVLQPICLQYANVRRKTLRALLPLQTLLLIIQ
jgi:hypothetical protein